jgi:hypothetical protein
MKSATKIYLILAILLMTTLSCGIFGNTTPTATPAADNPPDAEEESASPESLPTPEGTQPVTPNAIPAGDGIVPPPPADGGPCANTFYPLIPGYQWIYKVTGNGETSKVSMTVSEVNGNEATLNVLYLESGLATEATVTCDDGAIISAPVVLMGFLFGDLDGEITVEHQDGVFVPNYATLSSQNWDAAWNGTYLASGQITANIDGEPASATLENSPLEIEWHTLGAGETIFDGISVEAGSFPQAIKLKRTVNFDIAIEFTSEGETTSLSTVLTLDNNLWFEPNVGLLKQEVENASIKLYGVSFPIEMEGTLELVEFRQE